MHGNKQKCNRNNKSNGRNDKIDVALYQEICDKLVELGWECVVCEHRDFRFMSVNSKMSVFLSDGVLFMIKGDSLPPIVYEKDIENPEMDVIDAIDFICKRYAGKE